MKYITVKEAAEKWGISQVLVRRYCAQGRVPRAKCQNGTWCIPEKASKPDRSTSVITEKVELPPLGKKLVQQKKKKNYHGLYDYVQINLTYSSSRMASNRLTRDQVESIFRKGKVRESFEPMKVSDCIEVLNHTFCVDFLLDHIGDPLSCKFVQQLHYHLMFGTVDQRKKVVVPGVYRKGKITKSGRAYSPAARIASDVEGLINYYESIHEIGLVEILDFHVKFEMITPFEDGNGRIGRLIMFKECLCRLPSSYGCLIFNIQYPTGAEITLPSQEEVVSILTEILISGNYKYKENSENTKLNHMIAWHSAKVINARRAESAHLEEK